MRTRLLFMVVALAACSYGKKIKVCTGNHWWSCKYYSSEEELAKDEKLEMAQDVEAAKNLDINFDECAATILIDQISPQQLPKDSKIFISIIGNDPSENLLAILARAGIHAEPASKLDRKNQDHEAASIYNFSLIHKRLLGGYEAVAGYYCGNLCAGSTEYKLKKNKNSCLISSRNLLWVS